MNKMDDKMDLVEQLRTRIHDVERLPDERAFFDNPETLLRYLKAREWNVSEAEKQLRSTIEWRRSYRPLSIDCRWCHDKPGFHSIRQVGFDELGRPIIYACFAQASTNKNSVEDSVAHVSYLIENAKRTMAPSVGNWVFIMDCTGMSLPVCSPKLGYGVTQVLSTHYPERLGHVICVNHSPVFQGVWRAIKVFVHPNTVAKVQLIRSKKKMAEAFGKIFNDETRDWLIQEIKLNKTRPLPPTQKTFWRKPDKDGVHDPRGTASYIKQYIESIPPLSSKGGSVKDTFDEFTHAPHPNIIDHLDGILDNTKIISEDEKNGSEASGEADVSDSEDTREDFEELSISEEFQIPEGAAIL